ncbi:M48 family metalloprotease [Burkholderia multivorans]|uniref:M48 family metalloprotease n=1 Tax=Burkholderia multivorans TaxID=87883 RepID=UPI002019273C|nr:M48 family metalloprotease [Burkholderia multivorans]MCO1371581.1 M48 family metalloprotease [Burkholderia multivorans]MCO1457171.1 M48 family metalloprotease [Burkholderia multivorans]MCO1466157.1 M48 family metalloprotease [Burkholderia multivorans]UQO16144.1 M48 family metalloprotease [Burkholderia multivorans]UQO86487.1 M48 family metalloprotease [Burkholderia multivorans]
MAKVSLVGLCLACVSSMLIFINGRLIGDEHAQYVSRAILVFALLIFPIVGAANYFSNPIEREIKSVGFQDDPELTQLVRALIDGLGLRVRVGKYASAELNAFAISAVLEKEALIAFSTGLIDSASRSQLIAIAAHEVAHVKNGDAQNKTYILSFNHAVRMYPWMLSELSKTMIKSMLGASAVVGVLFAVLAWALSDGHAALKMVETLLGLVFKIGWLPILIVVSFYALNFALNSMFYAYSRAREFAADADGAAMTSPEDMKSALGLLTDTRRSVSVFDTHPPLEQRLARL